MKKLFLLSIIFSVELFSCDVMDPLKDDIDNLSDDIDEEITYTLTDDDYETLYDRILYLDSSDVTNANFIEANMYFTDDIASSEYIPMLLDVIYPSLSGASANITFNYNGSAPDELTALAETNSYTLTNADFESIDSILGYVDYFCPPYNSDDYIPTILKLNYKYEGSDDTVVVKYYYSDNAVKINFNKKINAVFSESFDEDLGLFTAYDNKGDQSWGYVSKDDGAVSINGYDEGYYDNEDWLVSPIINLTDVTNTYLQFRHNVRYYESGCLKLLVTTDLDDAVTNCTWSEYTISDPSTGVGEFVESKLFNLSAYDGLEIRIAFKYTSSASSSAAPEWSISEVKVGNYGYQVIGGGDTYLVQNYYLFDSIEAKWSPADDIYRLNQSDYESLGLSETAFSKSLPSQDYLPTLAEKLYPTASVGDVKYLVYDYDNGSDITLADALTKSDAGWTSSYAYIQEVTEPYRNSDGVWKFDPSVILTMGSDDYQTIVDYVNDNDLENSSTYSNTEYYYGASAYYDDFDVRTGYYNSKFESWQDAVLEALLTAFLPNKYADATQYVSGVEVYYYITFSIYTGATKTYTCTFGVSKDAPDPEFYLIDGPTEVE